MMIYYYDGTKELAREIEFCNDKPAMIVNGWNIVPLVKVLRILHEEKR